MISEIIAYIIATIAVGLLITNSVLNKRRRRDTAEMMFYTHLENELLKKEVQEQKQNVENAKLATDDSFVKFLSESRQWAFDYIESVQSSIQQFRASVEKSAAYYERAGHVVDSVHKNSLETFVNAYRELEKILPLEETTEEKNNEHS